jgi:SH3/ankyrin repeat-containing protein
MYQVAMLRPAVLQANLKRFMEHVQQKNVEKVSRWLDRGLDPNFHDADSGGQ